MADQPPKQRVFNRALDFAADQHGSAQLFIESLEARSEIDAVANRGVVEAVLAANIANTHFAGMQGHARAQGKIPLRGVKLHELISQAQGSTAGSFPMIGLFEGRIPNREDTVAD